MFQGDVVREGSNNFSPSQAGVLCLDHIQKMTVFEFSDMSSALAQESSSWRQGVAFLVPYFHCKTMCGLRHSVGQFRMWEIQLFLTEVSHSLLRIIPGFLSACIILLLVCPWGWDVWENSLHGFFWLYMLLCQEEYVCSLSQEISVSF